MKQAKSEANRCGTKRLGWTRVRTFARSFLASISASVAASIAAGLAVSSASAQSKTNHWAFEPVRNVSIPSVRTQAGRVQTPVDAFILARLEKEGLRLAEPADRRALIRRATFDLTGLPPTAEAVDQFLKDTAPGAFGRMVDRLLESPEYGERWARWWLDLARYADTNGQDENKVMANAWRYRDWVVGAFNSDKPFSDFTLEQLAGDLLPTNGVPERVQFDRWTATGFLVLGPKMLAEQDKPKLVMDLVDEQIDTVTRAFLGLTVSCARCHDHKYDPVPTRDYYALAGIFKSTRTMENLDFVSKFNERRVATSEELAVLEAHERGLKERTEAIDAAIREANRALIAERRHESQRVLRSVLEKSGSTNGLDPRWIDRARTAVAALENHPAALAQLRAMCASTGEFQRRVAELESAGNGMRLAPGRLGEAFVCDGTSFLEVPHQPELEPVRFTLETWVRVQEFPKEGDGRRWLISKNGNEWVDGHYGLVLDGKVPMAYLNQSGGRGGELLLRASDVSFKTGQWYHLAMTADERQLRLYVDGRKVGELSTGRVRLVGTGPMALGRRQDGYTYFKGQLDEARLWNRVLDDAAIQHHAKEPAVADTAGLVKSWTFDALTDAEREAAARMRLREVFYGVDGLLALPKDPRPEWPEATRGMVSKLEAVRDAYKSAAPPPPAYALAVAEDKPVELPIHIRGNHLQLAPTAVPRGFIQVVSRGTEPTIPAERSGRLELAQWLVDSRNPLTARVVVNRIWQAHFENGLVRTPENFGVRGELPTHPELLDWLASEFMRTGWSLKQLHRWILNSATWQASSLAAPDAAPPGKSVAILDPDNRLLSRFPRQRLEAEMVRDALLAVSGRLDLQRGGSLVNWKNNEYTPGDEVSASSVRRSIYLPIVRDRMYDPFTIFDCANPSVGTARRIPTVVAHQALFFLNSPLVKDSAKALTGDLMRDPQGDESQRVRLLYRRVLQRDPSTTEAGRALAYLERAGALVQDPTRRAAWASLCQTLLASNEFLYRD